MTTYVCEECGITSDEVPPGHEPVVVDDDGTVLVDLVKDRDPFDIIPGHE